MFREIRNCAKAKTTPIAATVDAIAETHSGMIVITVSILLDCVYEPNV